MKELKKNIINQQETEEKVVKTKYKKKDGNKGTKRKN